MRHHVRRKQRLELFDGLQAMDQQVGEHGQLVVADEFGGGIDEQRQRPGAGAAGVAGQWAGGRLGGEARHVGGQQYVAGPLLLPHLAEYPVNLPAGRRRHEIGLGAGDFAADPEEVLEVAVAERMVQRPPGALRILGGAADDVDDGHMLGVAARDRIGRREFTHAECRYHSGHSAQPSVPVGGVAGVELVGVAHPPDGAMGDDVVQKRQVVIAGNAEDLGDAEFGEAV